MTVRVVLLQSAKADLKDLKHYITRNFGEENWQASYNKIKSSVALIQSHRDAVRIPDELAQLNLMQYRQVLGGMNRIIYEIRGDLAYIHLICDVRKDLRSVLMKRLLRMPT